MALALPPEPIAQSAGTQPLTLSARAALDSFIEVLWASQSIDYGVVLALVSMVVGSVVLGIRQFSTRHSGGARSRRDRNIQIAGLLSFFLTVYLAFGSFRNQLKVSAEASLNAEAIAVFGLEMGNPNLRCLYDNYGYQNPNACLKRTTSSEDAWSNAIFYVEEALFVLTKAQSDRKQWGSDYANEVKFWAADISRDPTGMFAYYAVSSENTMSETVEVFESAGICMQDICQGYTKVNTALSVESRDHLRPGKCVSKDDVNIGRMACPLDPSQETVVRFSPRSARTPRGEAKLDR